MGNKGSWGKTQEAMDNQGGGLFLRLENDGDTAVVAFCGGPLPRDICFNEKTKQYEPWDEQQKAAGRKKQTKYAMNVYVASALGKKVDEMRVIDMNFKTMTDVISLKDKYGLSKCLFEIKRHGAKGDTKTQYQVLPDRDMTAEDRAVFGSPDPKDPENWVEGTMKLHDLDEAIAKVSGDDGDATVTDDVKKDGKKPKTVAASTTAANTNGVTGHAAPATAAPVAPAAAPAAAANGETLSKAAIDEIIGKLKPLDKDKGIDLFFAKFPYAKKVSQIRAADEAAARKLAAELASPPPPPAGEDPFA